METKLFELLDAALAGPEVVAVNFNHLRTLLIEIININKVVTPDVSTQNNEVSDSRTYDEGIIVDHLSTKSESEPKESDEIADQSEQDIKVSEIAKRFELAQNLNNERLVTIEESLSRLEANSDVKKQDLSRSSSSESSDQANEKNISSSDNKVPPISQSYDEFSSRLNIVERNVKSLLSLNKEHSSKAPRHYETSNIANEVESLKNEMNSFKKDFSYNKNTSNNDGLQKDLEMLKTDIMDIKKKVSFLSDNNSNLTTNKACETTENEVNSTEQNTKAIIENLNNRLTNIEKNFQESNHLNDIIENLRNEMLEITKDLSLFKDEVSAKFYALSDGKDFVNKSIDPELTVTRNDKVLNDEHDANGTQHSIAIRSELKDFESEMSKKLEKNQMEIGELVSDVEKNKNNIQVIFDNLRDQNKLINKTSNDVVDFDIGNAMSDLKVLNSKVEKMQDEFQEFMKNNHPQEEIEKIHSILKDITKPTPVEIYNERGPSLDSGVDATNIAAIQNLAQSNRQEISLIKAGMSIMQNNNLDDRSKGSQQNSSLQHDFKESVNNQLCALQAEQINISGNLASMLDDMKDEFSRIQQHVDALYDYIEKLQHSKADKSDISLEINVKADKKALDDKVNMVTFDERYAMLEKTLEDALSRIDYYAKKEASTNSALNKLNEDLHSKMNSDVENKLKGFLNERLKEIAKKNRMENVEANLSQMNRQENAAGLRKPMPLSYHCISCDRPIDVTYRGYVPSVPQNFPSKKSFAPHKSYELDQIRRKHKMNNDEKVYPNRHCGGQHTLTGVHQHKLTSSANNQLFADGIDTQNGSLSVIDCVVGNDGQIYKARYHSDEVLTNHQNRRTPSRKILKQKLRSSYSANYENQERGQTTPDKTRAQSANHMKDDQSEAKVHLPPIDNDTSMIKGNSSPNNASPLSSSTNSIRTN